MHIITFSGVDGSGKTTQRQLLEDFLVSQGKRVSYFHATEFSLANRLSRKAKGEESFTPGSEEAVSKAGFTSVLLRLIFLSLDVLRFEMYKKDLENKKVDFLLSDRFFQDSLINICYLSKNPLLRLYAKLLAPLLPKAEVAFYLNLSAEEILKRERVPEQGEKYLQEKIVVYNNPPFLWHPIILDATRSKEELHQKVLENLT